MPSVKLFAEGFVHYRYFDNDTLDSDSTTHYYTYDYLTFGINYDNNTSFFGRNGGLKFPYFSSDVTYFSSNGLWASVTFFNLAKSQHFLDGVDFAGGWIFDVNDHVDGGVTYSRFLPVQKNSVMVQSTASSVLNSYLGLDWNYLYTSAGLTYLLSGVNDYFLSISNSRYFEVQNLVVNDDILSFDPRLSFIIGTQNFALIYNSKIYNNVTQDATEKQALLKREHDKFKFLNFEVRFPFSYSYSNYTFEVEYAYSVPFNLVEGDNSYSQSLLTFSFYYTVGLPKKLKL